MSDVGVEEVMARIRASGGRVTHSRRLVVEHLLRGADHHVTAPDLFDALRAEDPEFHESTVYRVLERLADLGILEPVHGHPGATVFHLVGRGHRHHHLLCSRCGSVTEVDGSLLDPVAAQVARELGFVVAIDTPTTLPGLCAACLEVTGGDFPGPRASG